MCSTRSQIFRAFRITPLQVKKTNTKALDEVDPELLDTFKKLGISIDEQKVLAGVAVDIVVDSVSVATTFRDTLSQKRHHLLLHFRSN